MVSKRLVLIIDDDHYLRTFCEVVLSEAGLAIALADNAREGARLAETLAPDLILLDHVMPGLSGLEFLKALVDIRPRRTPVIMLSAWGSNDVRREAELMGAVWLQKPVSAAQLLAAVNATSGALTE